MKYLLLIGSILLSGAALAADGMISIASDHSVARTTERLESMVVSKGFNVIARVNHGKAAQSVGIQLKPVELLIFGKPKAGSLLMQSEPSVALDLPMKYLVWKNAAGQVRIGWNDPAWIASRHQITNRNKLLGKMSVALRKIAEQAAH